MTFARRGFTAAGVYGLVVLLPLYFLEDRLGRDTPPPITHPEFFYGFAGVAIAWQLAFLVIGKNPVRYRPLMIPAVVEKLAFGVPALVLFAGGRVAPLTLCLGLVDLALGAIFFAARARTPVE